MFTPDLDQPEDVLKFLTDPLRSIYEGLDDGVSFAELTLAQLPRDAHLWSHLVRYQACHYLVGLGSKPWNLAKLANSGMQISYGPIQVRVLKRLSDGPPHPGVSGARRDFYGQQYLPLSWGDLTTPASGANLIVDWNADAAHHVTLALSKPIGTWKYQGQPKLAWRCWVPFDDNGQPGFMPADGPSGIEPDLDLGELEDEEQIG
jgi:hypothetical protein